MLKPTIMEITPKIAEAFLERNTDNRSIRKSKVQTFAAALLAGNFKLTHQGIAIAPSGRVLDGQHRLLAIVQTGVPALMVVAFDTPEETYALIDRGTPRRVRDSLNLDSRIADPCSFIAKLHDRHRTEPVDVHEVKEACGPAISALLAMTSVNARGRTAAPIRAAAALRFMQTQDQYVLRQWRAFVLLDFDEMSSTMKNYYRQIASERNSDIKSAEARAARAWVAFDPARQNMSKIVIVDLDKIYGEMRAVWQPSWTRHD